MIVPKFKILLHTVYSSSTEDKNIGDLFEKLKAFYDYLTNHNCNDDPNHEHTDRSQFLFSFGGIYTDINNQTKRNDLYYLLDSLLKKDRNSLITSIQSATKQQEVLHILKTVLNEVGFDWNKYTKLGLPNAPQGQNDQVNNNSQKTGEREENDNPSAKEPTQNKIKKLLLPIIGVISVIGTLLFLAWNKLFNSEPIPQPKSDSTSKKKTLDLKQIFPQAQ